MYMYFIFPIPPPPPTFPPLQIPGVWYEAAGVLVARATVGPGEGLSSCTETVRHSAGTRWRPAGR